MYQSAASSVIDGIWYDSARSQQRAARLQLTGNTQVQVVDEGSDTLLASCPLASLNVPSRLGNTARHIYFDAGQKFETTDNDGVDALLLLDDSSRNLIYQLESHWRLVFVSLLLLAAFTWATVQYGLPYLSKVVAHTLPANVSDMTARQTLRVLDETVLSATTLEAARQKALQERFSEVLVAEPSVKWQVDFRHGGDLGANAFALPGGTIIFTDEIVELAASDEELQAVLAHEMGHVIHRHGERTIIQNSLMVFLIMAVTGDSSGIAEVFMGLPVLLVERAYSRDFEREADDYALAYLQANEMAPDVFVDMLERVELSAHCQSYFMVHEQQIDEQLGPEICNTAEGLQEFRQAGLADADVPDSEWQNYLSTHPDNEERRQRFVKSAL